MKLALSIDIGGTNTKIAIIDNDGDILKKLSFPTWKADTKKAFFDELFSKIDELVSAETYRQLIGIGIDAPSCLPSEGIIKGATNLPLKGEVPIVDILSMKYKIPVYMCNDANAAAIGEGQYGNARGMKNYVVITLGTGLGAGIIVNSQILTGNSGLAGELGHITVVKNGRQCNCGKKGCLETYISGTGIKRNFLALSAESIAKSSLNNLPLNKITAKEIGDAAKNGDAVSIKAFEMGGKILGENLADYVHIFEPEGVILAGGLAEVGEVLFTPTINALFDNLLPNFIDTVQVLPSALGTNEAALLGASSLVFNK